MARAAGVSNETIYAVFGNKQALLRAVLERAVRRPEPAVPLLKQAASQAIAAAANQRAQIALLTEDITRQSLSHNSVTALVDVPRVQRETSKSITAEKLQAACEDLLNTAEHPDEVTVRNIAQRAGAGVSAISYHFGSVEHLIFSVAERVYLRLNAERLALLQAAIQRAHPAPARIEDLIAAMVGPSIRWSLDATSSYSVLRHMTSLAQSSDHPEIFRPMIEDIDHHRLFVPHFRKISPWLSDVDIGFRISCLLGVRSQMTRNRRRTDELTNHMLDLGDPQVVLDNVIAATAPIFTTRPPANSNTVPNSSRH